MDKSLGLINDSHCKYKQWELLLKHFRSIEVGTPDTDSKFSQETGIT
jgi:hypothetical protein